MIIQILPVSAPLWAVFTSNAGYPDLRSVVCIGILDFGNGRRVVGAFPVGDHLEPADMKPDFVSLTSSPDPEPWHDRCAARRAEITAAQAKSNEIKLWTPEKEPIGSFQPVVPLDA